MSKPESAITSQKVLARYSDLRQLRYDEGYFTVRAALHHAQEQPRVQHPTSGSAPHRPARVRRLFLRKGHISATGMDESEVVLYAGHLARLGAASKMARNGIEARPNLPPRRRVGHYLAHNRHAENTEDMMRASWALGP